jgi:glycosyltransferase involved in cell wall biosynthesis
MRLFHIITALHTGGAERILAQLSHDWAGIHELHVAYLKPIDTLAGKFHPATKLHQIGLDLGTIGRLRKLFIDIQPDVVHTHLVHADFLGLWAARGLPLQRWTTLHNAHFRTGKADVAFQLAYKLLHSYLLPEVRAVAISKAVADHAKNSWGLGGRVHKVLNPLSAPQPHVTKEEARMILGLTPEQPVFTCLGRLEPQKGLTYALQAIAKVSAQGITPTLYIVGEGSLEATLEEEAAHVGLLASGQVHFTGLTSEPGLYLAAADALLLPSLFEGLGNVMAEAFSVGTPVIASAIEGPAEIIEEGKTGFLVPVAQVDAWANTLLTFCKDPALQKRMSLEAREKALAWPTPGQYAEALVGLYNTYM